MRNFITYICVVIYLFILSNLSIMNTTKKAFLQVSAMFSSVVFITLVSTKTDGVTFPALVSFLAVGVSVFVCSLLWGVSFKGIARSVGRFLRSVASGGVEVKGARVSLPSNF
jgi:hypothetical protein